MIVAYYLKRAFIFNGGHIDTTEEAERYSEPGNIIVQRFYCCCILAYIVVFVA